ncbi:MAG TPA: NUDIX hydrolase [Candidatus Paceibacterota bacterium]
MNIGFFIAIIFAIMEKYKLTENRERNGKAMTYVWHPGSMPEGIPVHQVYGFSLSPSGLIALVRDKGEERFTPPGGGVESGETALQGLVREFKEEAQFEPLDIRLLGSLEIINPSGEKEIDRHNLQVRFVCTTGKLDAFVPLKDGFEVEERIFVHYRDLPKYVGFIDKYTTGKMQFDMLCDHIEGKLSL